MKVLTIKLLTFIKKTKTKLSSWIYKIGIINLILEKDYIFEWIDSDKWIWTNLDKKIIYIDLHNLVE